MVKTYGSLFLEARKQLLASEGDNAALYARLLLCNITGKSMEKLIADRDLYASEEIEQTLHQSLSKMQSGKPLAYTLGTWPFFGLELSVCPDVLIPRDDTMAVTELAITKVKTVPANQRVLDLCTGSGCIGIAIAHEVPTARLTLVDASQAALVVAKQNVHNLKLASTVNCFHGDVFAPAPQFWGKFDVIVSNPPYIPKRELESLPASVRCYEPLMALDGGEDGLDFYRAIVQNFHSAIRPDGWLCLEFGMGQERDVASILESAGFSEIEFRKDYRGVIRAVAAKNIEK